MFSDINKLTYLYNLQCAYTSYFYYYTISAIIGGFNDNWLSTPLEPIWTSLRTADIAKWFDRFYEIKWLKIDKSFIVK